MIKNFKFFTVALFAIIGAGLLNKTVAAEQSQVPKLQKASLFLEWFLNPHHAPIVVGIVKGFFKEEGIDLELRSSSAGDEGVKQVAAGTADFALSGQPRHIMHVAKGMHLTHVATLFDHSMEGLATMGPKGSIKSLADLKGKKIGHASTGTGFTMVALKAMLQQHGVNPDEVSYIQVGGGIAQSLLSGRVDAVANVQLTYEFIDIQRYNPEAVLYTHGQAGIPEYDSSIVVANSDKLDKDLVEKFVKALTKACNYLRDNAEECWAMFANYKPELNTPTNKTSWDLVVPHFTREPGKISKERYRNFISFLKAHQALKGELPQDISTFVYKAA